MRRVFERGEEIVKIQREKEQAGDTDFLNNAERGTSQDTERIRPEERYSRTGERRWRDVSGYGESDQGRGTHSLESIDRGTSQDTERI
jgi:hypothetical protein